MLRNIYVYIKYITIGSDELNIIKQNLDKEVNLFIPDDIEEIDFEDSLVITDVLKMNLRCRLRRVEKTAVR